MDLLRELPDARQVEGEHKRRWFSSPEMDLIVWLEDDDRPVGFQLCYDKTAGEHALTWREGHGYDHTIVDDGEDNPAQHKSTPILRADGYFECGRVKAMFVEAAAGVPDSLRTFVTSSLDRYPGGAP